MKPEIYEIGFVNDTACGSETVQKQIDEVRKLDCTSLVNPEDINEHVPDWNAFDNPNESRSLFQSILRDRKKRIDEKTFMADRPNFAVITAVDGKAVRLEYYEGHDALSLVYDIRSRELTGQKLPKFMESDPQAYDPVEYLKGLFPQMAGKEKEVKELLDQVHNM